MKRTVLVAIGALVALTVVFLFALRPGCGPLSNTTRRISGRVVDETGQAVSGVSITFKWNTGLGLNPTKGPSENHVIEITSDADGRFSGRGRSYYTGVSARKEGYYPSSLSIDEKMPSESLHILLNRVRNPQPVLGKRAKIRLAAGFSRLEYDLIAGDCLPPHGKGTVADMVIEWSPPDSAKGKHPRDVISVRFDGGGNGATTQRIKSGDLFSVLRSWHEAPESGYAPSFNEADQNAGGFTGEYYGAERIHYLRIRSEDPTGPLFGKILGDVRYIPRPLSAEDEFEFEYVINPRGNRGLEMDMKRITVPGRHELEYQPDQF